MSNKTMTLMSLTYLEVRIVTGAKGIGCEWIMVGWVR